MQQKLSKAEAQKRVWEFIYAFRDVVVDELKNKIDFIIIYGSAVRHEFVPGKSDVDMVIQIFKEEDREIATQKATRLFWATAKHYPELGFETSLSVSKTKKRNGVISVLEKLEQSSFLYVPVFVFVKGEIDWGKGVFKTDNPFIKLGQNLLIPQRSVFLRFKQEGRVLFGRDIKKEIKIRLTLTDRFRLGAAPQLLSFIGFLVSPAVPKKGVSYAVKALLYQIDALITTLSRYQKMERGQKIEKSQKMLLKDFTRRLSQLLRLRLDYHKGALRPSDFHLFEEAIRIKWGELKLGYIASIWFCFKAFFFIIRSNGRAMTYLVLRRF